MKMKFLASVVLLSTLFVSGCATYTARIRTDKDIRSFQKIFVINNLDDNHHIDLLIVDAVKAHGFDAESGPPTMQPKTVDATITYQDHWTWDFSEHVTAVDLEMRDARNRKLIATAQYTGPVSMNTSAQEVINKLVDKLLDSKKIQK